MSKKPEHLTIQPATVADPDVGIVCNDPLSAVLTLVRTRGELLCRSYLTAPFGVAFPSGPVHFHAVDAGSVWVRTSLGHAPIRVGTGAFLLFPHGDGHTISSARDGSATPLEQAVAGRTADDRAAYVWRYGGGGDQVDLTCLRFAYDNPLARRWLETLPRVVVVSPHADRGGVSLGTTVRALLTECERPAPGGAIMVARLIDLLFIQVLRIWIAEHPAQIGWLAGAADERIGRALAAVHGSPAYHWTITQLAERAGLARSAFNARFTALVGKSPMAYVVDWRLNLAADRLQATRDPIRKIAFDVGYISEAGFSRAFKARFNLSPKRFRENNQTLGSTEFFY